MVSERKKAGEDFDDSSLPPSDDEEDVKEDKADKTDKTDKAVKGDRRLLKEDLEAKKIRLANLETKFRDDVDYYKEKINLGRNCTINEKS